MKYLKRTLKTSVCALAALSLTATGHTKVSPTADLQERHSTIRKATAMSEAEDRILTRLSGRLGDPSDQVPTGPAIPAENFPRVFLVQNEEPTSDEPTSLFKQFRSYPLVDRALRLMERGAYDESRSFLDRAFEVDPNNPRIWYVSALLEIRRENPQLAEEHASKALELDDTNAVAQLYRGIARGQLNDKEGAQTDLDSALTSKKLTRAEMKWAEQTLADLGLTPTAPETLVAEAETQEETAPEASPELETSVAEEPAEEEVETEEQFAARLDDLEAAGSYETAYEALAERDSLSEALKMRRAQNAFRIGRLDDARRDLKGLMDNEIDTDVRVSAARLAAEVEAQRGNDKAAVAALDIVEQAGELTDEERSAYVEHALEIGQTDQAIRHLTDLFDGAAGERKVEIGTQLANLLSENDKKDLARTTLQKLAEDESLSTQARVRAWDSIAGLAAEQNDTDAVVAAYNKAFELSGDSSYQAKLESAQPEASVEEEVTEPATVEETAPALEETVVAETETEVAGPTAEELAAAQAAAQAAEKEATQLALEDRIRAAEQLAMAGKTGDAIDAFDEVAKDEADLNAGQRERIFRSLAQLHEQREDYAQASANWKKVYGLDRDVETAIEIARTARLADEHAEARTYLNLIVAERLSPELQAVYYDEVSLSFERDSAAAALDPARKAVFAKDATFRRMRVADLLTKLNRPDEAVLELQQALILEPNNAGIQRSLGYAYLDADQADRARMAFERVLELDPKDETAKQELDRLGIDEEPVVAEAPQAEEPETTVAEPEVTTTEVARVEDPVVAKETVTASKPPLKLEIEQAVETETAETMPTTAAAEGADGVEEAMKERAIEDKKRFFFDTQFVYREGDNPSPAKLPEAGPSQSFIFAKGGIFLPAPTNWPDLKIALTGRLFGAFEEDSLDYDGDTTQAGVGIRFIPFAKHDLVLDVERLIKIGDNARDAWLITSAYSWEYNGEMHGEDMSWNFTAFDGEVAYIPNEPEIATAFAELLQGRMFAIADSFAIYPHALVSFQFNDEEDNSDTLVEIGPGVGFRYWFNRNPKGHMPTTMDVRLQYRFSLADNRDDDHEGGFVGTVKFKY